MCESLTGSRQSTRQAKRWVKIRSSTEGLDRTAHGACTALGRQKRRAIETAGLLIEGRFRSNVSET
jgi:hypothetical protein